MSGHTERVGAEQTLVRARRSLYRLAWVELHLGDDATLVIEGTPEQMQDLVGRMRLALNAVAVLPPGATATAAAARPDGGT